MSATLKINGLGVRVYNQPPGEPYPLSVPLGVIFDSTHFANLSNIVVSVDAIDALFNVYHAENYAPAKNRVLIYEHPDLSAGANEVNTQLTPTNIARSVQAGTAWTASAFFSDMDFCSLLYVSTHGNPSLHSSGDAGAVYSGATPTTPNYLAERTGDIGTGYPPFNSTGMPDISLGYIYACNVGDSNAFNRMCYPYWNAYSEYWVNHALLAYKVYVVTTQADEHAELIYEELVPGYTTSSAQAWLILNAADKGLLCWDTYDSSNPKAGLRNIALGDLLLYGDVTTRIRTVYTGDNFPPIGWYR